MKIPKKIDICGKIFTIKQDKTLLGAAFDFDTRIITLGTNSKQEGDIFEGLMHEISEAIHIIQGTRFEDVGNSSYLFVQNHNTFQSHIEILSSILYNIYIDGK